MKKVSTLALQYIWINWSTTFSFYWHGLSKLNWLKQVYINIFILFDRWYAESLSYYSAFTGITTSQVIVWNIVLEKNEYLLPVAFFACRISIISRKIWMRSKWISQTSKIISKRQSIFPKKYLLYFKFGNRSKRFIND